MNEQKYVKKVVNNVKCGHKQRKKISSQLLAEIRSEVEAGRSLEDVLDSMGNAKEAVAEFNDNLSSEDIRKYKKERLIKILLIIAACIAILCVAVYCIMPKAKPLEKSDVFDKATVEQQISQVIELLNEEDYAMLRNLSTDKVKPSMTSDVIESAKKNICEDWGEFLNIGTIYASEIKQSGNYYAVGQVSVSYENVSVTYTITFDKDMRIAGLFMK